MHFSNMFILLAILFVLDFQSGVSGQLTTVSNVRVVDHIGYMVNVIGETMKIVEERGWCNLKLNDMTQHIDEDILAWDFTGTVHYKNGFVSSIYDINILQSGLAQIWRFSGETNTTTVELTGTLQLHDLALGFDVEVEINGENHKFTGIHIHSLVTFIFRIFKNANTDDLTVTVELDRFPASLNKMSYLPSNRITEVLSQMAMVATYHQVDIKTVTMAKGTLSYDRNSTYGSVSNWADQIFQPIALDVIRTKIEFPDLCYNCAV